MGQVITSGDLVKQFGGELIGDPNILIDSATSLESSHQKSVSFFNNPKYQDLLNRCNAYRQIYANDVMKNKTHLENKN